MDKNAIIIFLTLVIGVLLVLIAYLMSRENQPQPEPEPEPEPLPEFPADELLEEIENDFDQLALKWKKQEHGSMEPNSRIVLRDVPEREVEKHKHKIVKKQMEQHKETAEDKSIKR